MYTAPDSNKLVTSKPPALSAANAGNKAKEDVADAAMGAPSVEVADQEDHVAFWRNISRLKREIKQLEKQAILKRKELNIAFDEVCAKFAISSSSETEK